MGEVIRLCQYGTGTVPSIAMNGTAVGGTMYSPGRFGKSGGTGTIVPGTGICKRKRTQQTVLSS